MTEPDDLQFTHGHPLPTRDHATLLSSYHLLLGLGAECFPVRIRPTGKTTHFESWELTRAALMARMASTLRHLGYLAPSYSRLDGLALARTLVDHVITFAWISADPKERLPVFLCDSFKNQLAKDRRYRERSDPPLIKDALRERLSAYTREVNREMPKLPRRSREADEHWREQARPLLPESLRDVIDFQRWYRDVYDHYAASDHPTTLGLEVFVHLAGNPVVATVDGEPVRDDLVEDLRPYWIAAFAFAAALLVSHLASGRPRLHGMKQTLQTIGTMRNLERAGRLAVEVKDDGSFSIGLADEDEGSAAPGP
jgi:hypothetical protein